MLVSSRDTNSNTWVVLGALVVLLSSCNLTKRIPDDRDVYMGTKIEITDPENSESVDKFAFNIRKIPKRGTQTGIGNIYTGLYNIYKNTGDKGFKHWVKYKLGKEPVLYENSLINDTEARLTYYLNGKGFFGRQVACDSTKDDRKVNIECKVTLGNRYTLDSLVFPVDSTYAALRLDNAIQKLILKEGSYYDRDRLNYERNRIATLAGAIGFADFGAENVYYYVDTAKGTSEVDLYMKILTPTDSTFHTRYILDSINVYPNYTLNDTSTTDLQRDEINDRLVVYEKDHYLDHKLLDRLMLLKTETYYNRVKEKKSINRLLDLGLFKFINVNNQPSGSGKIGHIVQNVYLTPENMQNISGEVELNNRSGNFLGLGASARYTHKNIFRHAERLNLSIGGQVETQFGEGVSFINSSDINGSAEIVFPRLIVPFFKIRESRNYIPRTIIKTTFNHQRRTQYYTLQSLTGKYGYRFRTSGHSQHELFPIVISQLRVSNKTAEFQTLLDEDVRLSGSFDDVLIMGMQYFYTYSNQATRADRNHRFFKFEMETSGNLAGLFLGGSGQDPGTIAGEKFAQYVKLTVDYRKYFQLGVGDIATRIVVGTGFAYGNSTELPYTEQYLIGGSNSVRAFRLRGLGPGAFFTEIDPNDTFSAQFIDQTGDMKIEANIEYRFPIFSYLKGAFFADAGNVWLIDSPDLPEGNFKIGEFYKEIGVGAGVGIRIDFDFFLIRMDMAFPLRAPTKDGFEWQVSAVNPLSASWRSENLRYNLGIGYPF